MLFDRRSRLALLLNQFNSLFTQCATGRATASHTFHCRTVASPSAGGDADPYTTSFRGIDNPTYYMTDTSQYVQLLNFSGCGNTTNANNPIMKKLIIDSLRMCAAPGSTPHH